MISGGCGGGDEAAEFRSTISTTSDIEIIGETDDGLRALELLRILRPHVALLDADLPSLGGNAVARVLADELPDVHVVVLTGPE